MQEQKTTTINPLNKKFYSKDNSLIGGVIENYANAKTFKVWTKDFWQKDNLNDIGKGVGKSMIILGMITVGVLLGPISWGAALIGALAIGVIIPKIAYSLGSKGMAKSSEHRSRDRLEKVTLQKIIEKKQSLEKTASRKIKFGIGAIMAAVLIPFVIRSMGLLLLPVALAIGGTTLYLGKKDAKLVEKVQGINDKSTVEEVNQAGLTLGLIKEKDLNIKESKINEEKQVVGKESSSPNKVELQNKDQGSVQLNPEEVQEKNKILEITIQGVKNDLMKQPNIYDLKGSEKKAEEINAAATNQSSQSK